MFELIFFENDCRGTKFTFENGLTISLQWGSGTYSDNRIKLFEPLKNAVEECEVAVFDENGNIVDPKCYGMEDNEYYAESVCGYVSADDVAKAIALVANLKKEEVILAESGWD